MAHIMSLTLYALKNMNTLGSVGSLLEASKLSKQTLIVEVKKALKNLYVNFKKLQEFFLRNEIPHPSKEKELSYNRK